MTAWKRGYLQISRPLLKRRTRICRSSSSRPSARTMRRASSISRRRSSPICSGRAGIRTTRSLRRASLKTFSPTLSGIFRTGRPNSRRRPCVPRGSPRIPRRFGLRPATSISSSCSSIRTSSRTQKSTTRPSNFRQTRPTTKTAERAGPGRSSRRPCESFARSSRTTPQPASV